MTFHISVGPKQTISHYHETLGEALQGTELEFSGLEIEFKGKPCIFAHHVRLYHLMILSIFVQNNIFNHFQKT